MKLLVTKIEFDFDDDDFVEIDKKEHVGYKK